MRFAFLQILPAKSYASSIILYLPSLKYEGKIMQLSLALSLPHTSSNLFHEHCTIRIVCSFEAKLLRHTPILDTPHHNLHGNLF